jgi:hypothetical protein
MALNASFNERRRLRLYEIIAIITPYGLLVRYVGYFRKLMY